MFTHSLAMKKRHLKESPQSLGRMALMSALMVGMAVAVAAMIGTPSEPVMADVLRVDVAGE